MRIVWMFALLLSTPSVAMADVITIRIDDDVASSVYDMCAEVNGYEPTIRDAEGNVARNPQTKKENLEAYLKQVIVDSVSVYYSQVEEVTARDRAQASGDAIGGKIQ